MDVGLILLIIDGLLMVVLLGVIIYTSHQPSRDKYPTHIEERWLELQRVTKSEWCHFMGDTSHREEWQRWYRNIKERRKNDEES